jgi:hypothetical protein
MNGDSHEGFTLEVGDRKIQKCPHCGNPRVMIWTAVFQGEKQVALDYAFLYDHNGDRDVYQDMILGSWTERESDWTDHVTFSTHTRFDDKQEVGTMLIDGGSVAPDGPFYGHKMSRVEGLEDDRLPLVWRITDQVLAEVHDVHAHLTGAPLPRRRWFRR